MQKSILADIQKASAAKKKQLAVLIDPDKTTQLPEVLQLCKDCAVDYLFVGGSLLYKGSVEETLSLIKSQTDIPVVLFPGSTYQLHPLADAVLFLSLISGRNPELLIGKHVEAAPLIRAYDLEALPTGYMLIDGGNVTTASYISNTTPIPSHKPEIAACTALAGKYLGLQVMYLDAGSGAVNPVSNETIHAVKATTGLPVIVGGGIRTAEQAAQAWNAGADILVIGTAIEENISFIGEVKQNILAN